jgi:DNA repair exonuclease SbcCD nuclease subunit
MVLITSDFHFHNHLGNNDFIKHAGEYLKYLLGFCQVKKIKEVIIAGDIFNCNDSVNIEALLEVKDRFHDFEENGITIHIVTGNHDLFYRRSVTRALTSFFSRKFHVVKDYENIEIDGDTFHFINYTTKIDLEKFEIKKGVNILISHLEINGFMLNNHVKASEGVNSELFSKFDFVFNGHHHNHENIHNIINCGAPYHIRFDDVGKERGFVLYENKKWEFVPYSGIEYVVVEADKVDIKKLKNKVVRIKHDIDKVSEKEIINLKAKLKEITVFVDVETVSKDKEERTEDIGIELSSFHDSYKKYLSKFHGELNKEKLINTFDIISASK